MLFQDCQGYPTNANFGRFYGVVKVEGAACDNGHVKRLLEKLSLPWVSSEILPVHVRHIHVFISEELLRPARDCLHWLLRVEQMGSGRPQPVWAHPYSKQTVWIDLKYSV